MKDVQCIPPCTLYGLITFVGVIVLCFMRIAFFSRLERVSINMNLLEEKVDSAVASHEAAEVAKGTRKQVPASQAEPCAEEPPSTAASASDVMEEIDTGPVAPGPSLTKAGPQYPSCTTSCEALPCTESKSVVLTLPQYHNMLCMADVLQGRMPNRVHMHAHQILATRNRTQFRSAVLLPCCCRP